MQKGTLYIKENGNFPFKGKLPLLCLKQSSGGMALAIKKAVKIEEGWTDAYSVPELLLALLISGLRATDVMLSVRTTRSLC